MFLIEILFFIFLKLKKNKKTSHLFQTKIVKKVSITFKHMYCTYTIHIYVHTYTMYMYK